MRVHHMQVCWCALPAALHSPPVSTLFAQVDAQLLQPLRGPEAAAADADVPPPLFPGSPVQHRPVTRHQLRQRAALQAEQAGAQLPPGVAPASPAERRARPAANPPRVGWLRVSGGWLAVVAQFIAIVHLIVSWAGKHMASCCTCPAPALPQDCRSMADRPELLGARDLTLAEGAGTSSSKLWRFLEVAGLRLLAPACASDASTLVVSSRFKQVATGLLPRYCTLRPL